MTFITPERSACVDEPVVIVGKRAPAASHIVVQHNSFLGRRRQASGCCAEGGGDSFHAHLERGILGDVCICLLPALSLTQGLPETRDSSSHWHSLGLGSGYKLRTSNQRGPENWAGEEDVYLRVPTLIVSVDTGHTGLQTRGRSGVLVTVGVEGGTEGTHSTPNPFPVFPPQLLVSACWHFDRAIITTMGNHSLALPTCRRVLHQAMVPTATAKWRQTEWEVVHALTKLSPTRAI